MLGIRVELTDRVKSVNDQYTFINNSNLFSCAEECWEEMKETKVMPTLSEEELADFEVRGPLLISTSSRRRIS